MTLQRNSSPVRKTAPPGAQHGMGTRATGKGLPGKMWNRIHSLSVPSTPLLGSPRIRRWAEVARGASPSVAAGRLPTCSRQALPGAAGPLPALWQGLPVAYPKQKLSAPHGWLRCARDRQSFSDLFRERAGCLQELKLLCKEQRRRAEAGRRPRGRPHRGAAAAAARHGAKLEVGVQVRGSSSVRPAMRTSVLAGQRCGA